MAVIPWVVLVVLQPAGLGAQTTEAECRLLLQDALQLRNTPADSGYAFYRAMRVVSITSTGDTLETEAVSIEAGDLYVIRTDSSEVWQDSRSMAVVDHQRKQVRLVDLSDRSEVIATRRRYQEVFFDSLASHLQDLSCRSIHDTSRISGTVIPEMRLFYKTQGVTIDVRPDGEIIRYVTEHPDGSAIRQTEYIVTSLNRRYTGVDPEQSVREHFLDTGQVAGHEYSGYRLIGL